MSNYYYETWGYGNCAGIRPINNYEQAKEKYESTAWIRGRREDVRPLGSNRRYTWYRIVKETIADQFKGTEYNTYAAELYGSNCVTFFPDGKVEINTYCWASPTTMSFINYTTREFGFIVSMSGKWYWRVKATGKMYPIPTTRVNRQMPLVLMPNESGVLEPTNTVKEYKYSVSRKAMNALRKKYSHFTTYVKVALSMSPEIVRWQTEDVSRLGISEKDGNGHMLYPKWASEEQRNTVIKNRQALFNALESGDPEVLYQAMQVLTYTAGHYSYRTSKVVCTPQDFDKYFDDILKVHFRDEVFNKQEVEVGIGFIDRNARFFM